MASGFPAARFVLFVPSRQRYARRGEERVTHLQWHHLLSIGESRYEEEAVLEVGSPHPTIPRAVTLLHVETGEWLTMTDSVMSLRKKESQLWDSYFWLDSAARMHATNIRRPETERHVPVDSPLMHFTIEGDQFWHKDVVLNAVPATFTVHEYEGPVAKMWRQLEFDSENALIEQAEVFTTSAHRFDNSEYDQAVIIRPSVSFSETMETTWARTQGQAFAQSMSVSVSASVPFVDVSTELGFTAEQSFSTEEGGGIQFRKEDSVEVEVPVPPFRKVEVVVVGMRGKVTVPFRFVEIATFKDGSRRERVLQDGITTNVSSVSTEWRARYYDHDDRPIDTDTQYSGALPKLLFA